MAYVVTGACKGCRYSDCVPVCPVDAFHQGTDMLYINPEVCIDCNACVAECPVDAIYADCDLPEELWEWVQINGDMCEIFPEVTERLEPLAPRPGE